VSRQNLPAASPRRLVALALAAMAFAAPGCQAAGQSVLSVSATVARHASIRLAPPSSISVSSEDVARGWIELPAPVEMVVQSNAPQGYTVSFQAQGELVRLVEVKGMGDVLRVGTSGLVAARPAPGRGMWRETLQLRFRFELAPQVAPGEHPWPLATALLAD
jgi:hypothetical protein